MSPPRPHVLSLALVALVALGCSRPERVDAPEGTKPHYGDDWFSFRAGALGISVAAAQSRDAALPEDRPPERGLDRTTAVEAAAIYRDVCITCHGANGDPPDHQPGGGAAPHAWGGVGTRMGFFFGGDEMRAGLFRTIEKGGAPRGGVGSSMPAWSSVLSREQSWALVRHFESF